MERIKKIAEFAFISLMALLAFGCKTEEEPEDKNIYISTRYYDELAGLDSGFVGTYKSVIEGQELPTYVYSYAIEKCDNESAELLNSVVYLSLTGAYKKVYQTTPEYYDDSGFDETGFWYDFTQSKSIKGVPHVYVKYEKATDSLILESTIPYVTIKAEYKGKTYIANSEDMNIYIAVQYKDEAAGIDSGLIESMKVAGKIVPFCLYAEEVLACNDDSAEQLGTTVYAALRDAYKAVGKSSEAPVLEEKYSSDENGFKAEWYENSRDPDTLRIFAEYNKTRDSVEIICKYPNIRFRIIYKGHTTYSE